MEKREILETDSQVSYDKTGELAYLITWEI